MTVTSPPAFVADRAQLRTAWALLTLVSAVTSVLLWARGSAVLDDPFHYGEYFAAAAAFLGLAGPNGLPYTIHGGLDFIPALLASALAGPTRYMLPTVFIYHLCSLIAAFAFVATAWELSRTHPARTVLRVIAIAMAPMVVGFRDLFLVTALYYFVYSLRTSSERSSRMWAYYLVGALLGAGIFWSFDRGIAGVGALGAATMALAYWDAARWRTAASFAIAVVAMSIAHPSFSFPVYLENLRFLLSTASQWSYAPTPRVVALIAFATAINAIAATSFLLSVWPRRAEPLVVGEAVALLSLAGLMWKAGTGRADFVHVLMTLWVPLLLVARVRGVSHSRLAWAAVFVLLYSIIITADTGNFIPVLLASVICYGCVLGTDKESLGRRVLFLALAATVLQATYWVTRSAAKGQYAWLARIWNPPENEMIVTDPLRWAASELRRLGASCVFDLSNHGVINGLTLLPSCTQYTYPVYADHQHEQRMVDQLKTNPPPAIIYSSTHWSYDIDGKSMRDRFPTLERELKRLYTKEICRGGYCLRYL